MFKKRRHRKLAEQFRVEPETNGTSLLLCPIIGCRWQWRIGQLPLYYLNNRALSHVQKYHN